MQDGFALHVIDSYLGITSGVTFVYFALPVGVKNLFSFMRRVTGRSQRPIQIWSVIMGGTLGTIRMLSQIATSNLLIKNALVAIGLLSSRATIEDISAGITLSAVPLCS